MSGALVAPRYESTIASRDAGGEPCAKVSELYANGKSQVPASLAYDCLQSVPVDVSGNVELVDEMGAYFEWQSNQAYVFTRAMHCQCPFSG